MEDELRGSCSLRTGGAPYSGGAAADVSLSLARQQQGEQAVAGSDVVFQCPLVLCALHTHREQYSNTSFSARLKSRSVQFLIAPNEEIVLYLQWHGENPTVWK